MSRETDNITIWDPALRLFHWMLACMVSLAIYSGWQGKLEFVSVFGFESSTYDWGQVHVYAAHGILVLIIWRILWGLVGSDTAKLSRLIPTRAQIWAAITKAKGTRAVGHDALGSLGTIFLLSLIALQAGSGQYIEDDDFFAGPLNGALSAEITRSLKSIHHLLGDLLPWLLGAHIAVMIFYRVINKVNLVQPMITGKAPAAQMVHDRRSARIAPLWRALPCLLIASAAVYFWTGFTGPTSLF